MGRRTKKASSVARTGKRTTSALLVACLLMAMLLPMLVFNAPKVSANPDGDAPIARTLPVTFAIDNKIYVGTGWGGSSAGELRDFWEYNPYTGVWTQKENFGGVGRDSAFGFSINGKGYIGGGGGEYPYSPFNQFQENDFWEYNPDNGHWTQKENYTSFGMSARFYAFSFSINGKGYVGCGQDNTGALFKDVWEYDPSTDIWTQKENFGGSARSGTAWFTIGNYGYVGTGWQTAGSHYTKDFWRYDPSLDNWTRIADFGGSARTAACGFSIGSKGYVGTGYTGSAIKDFWRYDNDNGWTQKADFGGATRYWSIGFSVGNSGCIGMGYNGASNMYADFWSYDPTTDTWASGLPVFGWYQTDWAGGATTPSLQVGTWAWNSNYDNYYTGENENNEDGELRLVGGVNLLHDNDSEITDDTADWVKVKSWTTTSGGTLRIDFDLADDFGIGYGRIYRNGNPVGTQREGTERYETFTENIEGWSIGDNIELWIMSQGEGDTVYARNFRIYGSYYSEQAYIESSIYDATYADWENVYWNVSLPTGTSMTVTLRSGNDNNPYDSGWSGWCQFGDNIENDTLPNSRYVQYRIDFSTTDNTKTPRLYDITITYENATPPPAQPHLISPENELHTTDNTPTFLWENGENADNHRLLIDNDSNFSTPNENRIVLDNTYTIVDENSLADGVYYWKVIAINAGGENESDVRWFRVNSNPTCTNLKTEGQVNPIAIMTFTPAFSWSYSDNDNDVQSNYQIQVGVSENNNSMWDNTGAALTQITYSGNTLSRGVTYYVRVRVKDNYEWSSWANGTFKLSQSPTVTVGSSTIELKLVEAGDAPVIPTSDFTIMLTVRTRGENLLIYYVRIDEPPQIPTTGIIPFYFDIHTTDPNAILDVTITFNIPKSWVQANDIVPETLVAWRNTDGTWQPLTSRLVGGDALYYYLEATTGGFSLFGVSGQKRVVTSNELPTEQQPSSQTPVSDRQPQQVIFIVALGIIIISAMLLVNTFKHHKQRK